MPTDETPAKREAESPMTPDDPAPTRGRWTIPKGGVDCPECGGHYSGARATCAVGHDRALCKPRTVEVVPVPDEAAIERGAKAAREAYVEAIERLPIAEMWPFMALAVLRAALEAEA